MVKKAADFASLHPPYSVRAIILSAAILLWPALLNGYPLVFSDTGTYLSQIPHHYLGWDRPPFYSAFLFAFDWNVTTWPAIAAQALSAAWVLDAMRRGFAPERGPEWTVVMSAALAVASPLGWIVAELMPDVFTGLLVLAMLLLALRPERFGRLERAALEALLGFAVVAHLGNLPLAVGLGLLLTGMQLAPAAVAHDALRCGARLLGPVLAAVVALCAVNIAGRGIVAVAPYGNVFLLARVLYDGPGMRALHRDCPDARWRLCAWRDDMPATADDFLWRRDSPLTLAGGPKLESGEAGAIIADAARHEPGTLLVAAIENTARQLARFASGDGLQPWPATVTPWLDQDFPHFERRAYREARQTRGEALLPGWMSWLHWVAGLGTAVGCVPLLPWLWRRDRMLAAALLACLFALLLNAAVTGALSGPHDRYQCRVMWLPMLLLMLAPWRQPSGLGVIVAAAARLRGRGGDVFWCAVEAGVAGALSFVGAFALARMIGAAGLGVGAGVASVHVLLWVGVNAVLADAVVQRPALSEADAGSAIAAGLLVGLAGAMLQVAACWPLRAALGDPPLLGAMCLALALPLPLVGAAGPVQGLLTRTRDYRRLARRTALGQGVGLAVGLAVAARGGGAWAVVGQQAAGSLIGALVLLGGGGWRARLAWRKASVIEMLRIGVPLAGSTLILHGRYRVFALLVGGVAGPAVLGQVHMAFRLVETVRELASTAMWRLLLPLMAERQHDRAAMLRVVDRALRLIAMTLVPLCAALAVAIRPLMGLLLGPGWAPSAAAAIPLAALAAWMFVTFPSGVATVALGFPRYGQRVQAGVALLAGGLVLLLRPATPLAAVLAWMAAHAVMAPYALATNAHVLRCGPWRTIAAGLPGLAVAVLLGGAALLAARILGPAGLAGGLGAIALAAAIQLRPPAWRVLPRLPARP